MSRERRLAVPWWRVLVGAASLASLGVGLAASLQVAHYAPQVLAAGALAFFLLPLVLPLPRGGPTRLPGGGERWIANDGTLGRLDRVARFIGVAAWQVILFTGVHGDGLPAVYGFLLGLGCIPLALGGLSLRVRGATAETLASLTLERDTCTIRESSGGVHVVRYADVADAWCEGAVVWITTATDRFALPFRGGRAPRAVAAKMVAALKAAQAAAAERAAAPRADVPAPLRRPRGASVREWLASLDALAAAAHGPRAAFRAAAAPFEEETLWAVVEDEHADADARAAAARVLARSPNETTRARLGQTLAGMDDDLVRLRIASATKADADTAAAELEALETAELARATR